MNACGRVLYWLLCCFPVLAICFSGDVAAGADEKPVKTESHFARLGTNRIHYLTYGQGINTIVFIHGWACNAGFWREQVPVFQEKAKLVLIDLPGHGESDKPETDYTMDYFADAVIAVMRDAKVEKATLVGHSMGAPVICKVYAKAPERIAGLVAVDGFMRRPKVNAEQAENMAAPYRKPEYRVFNLKQAAWDLAKVDVPVMSINAKSPMWTESYEKYVRSLWPNTEYRLLEGTGHFVMLEKPSEFNSTLMEMLTKFDLVGK